MPTPNPTVSPSRGAIAMSAKSVRWPVGTWEAVVIEAQVEGVSAARFVRDATLARAVASYEARGGQGNPALDRFLGRRPQHAPGEREPIDAKAAYERLMAAAQAGLEVPELVPRERQDLMTILRMAEARSGMVRRWPGGER